MIPQNIERQHIVKAIQEIDSNGTPSSRQSSKFCISFEGKQYSPKYVLSLANKFVNEKELNSSSFNGGQETNNFLKHLEFEIVEISLSGAISGSTSSHKNIIDGVRKDGSDHKTIIQNSIEQEPTDQVSIKKVSDTMNVSSKKTQKDFLIKLLRQRFGCVLAEVKFDWLKVPDRVSKDGVLDGIYENLVLIRGCKYFPTPGYQLTCDFFIPAHNLIIEYDEKQHFTIQRAESLAHYPSDLNIGFDKDKWCEACETIKATDKKPIYRDEQRAFYDSVRDILAAHNGMTLIRIKDGDYDWGSELAMKTLNKLINDLKLDASPSDIDDINVDETIEQIARCYTTLQETYRKWARGFKNHEEVVVWLKSHNLDERPKQKKLNLLCSYWNPVTISVLRILAPDCIANMKNHFNKLINLPDDQIHNKQIWYLLYFLHPVRHETYFFDIHYPHGYTQHLSGLLRSHRLGLLSAQSYLCNEEDRKITGSHISSCGTMAFKHLHIHPTTSEWGEPNLEDLTEKSVLDLNIEDGDISSEEQKVAIDISARAKPSFENWFGYAPCAINEGPIFTLKKGKKHSDCFKAIVEILNDPDHKQDTMRGKLKEFYEINDENKPCV